jgi:Fe-S-cluster containining protein
LEKLRNALIETLAELKNVYNDDLSKLHITGKLPVAVKKLLARSFNLFDESYRLFISRHHSYSSEVKCHIGCHFCCYQAPYGISIIEYLYLYEGMCKTSPGRLFLPTLLDRTEFIASLSQNIKSTCELLKAYSRKMLLCPFLDKNSRLCMVYAYRPLICRMHISFSAPRFCHPLHEEPWRCEAVNIESSDAIREVLAELDDVFPFSLSQFLFVGITEFMVNIMRCQPIKWWS